MKWQNKKNADGINIYILLPGTQGKQLKDFANHTI